MRLNALRQLQKDRGCVPQTQNRDCEGAAGFVPQSDRNPDCQGGVNPPLTEPRPKEAVANGFVPPPCPADEDIDPAEWAIQVDNRIKTSAQRALRVS